MQILLVEDHPAVANLSVQLLRSYGHVVYHTTTADDALRSIEVFKPNVALIDIGLPGVDGYQLARRMRADPRFNPVILVALTGYASEADRELARLAGFDAHFAKPMDFEQLPTLQRQSV